MPSNPFSTRYIRPGALPYLYEPGESTAAVIERLRSCGWRGQILGSHGSGKSTLLATLAPALAAAGRVVISLALHNGERKLPLFDHTRLTEHSQLVIDGYEQLSWWSRWRVRRLCRLAGAGLLVTAHADAGLPTIYRTQPSAAMAQRIVETLLPAGDTRITPAEVSAAYSGAQGNLRETLFALFDTYQRTPDP